MERKVVDKYQTKRNIYIWSLSQAISWRNIPLKLHNISSVQSRKFLI
jgi:hypothetical protein